LAIGHGIIINPSQLTNKYTIVMAKRKSQKHTSEAAKPTGDKKPVKKTIHDYTAEELDAMDDDEVADLFAEDMVDNLNDPDSHDKSL
jgi:hypothetical protein